jgi:hypothetical protein
MFCRIGNFLLHDLPELLEDVPLAVRARMWYMHDGALAHFSRSVRDVLSNTRHDRWTEREESTVWSLCSPDLNPLDFYLWEHLVICSFCWQRRHFTIAIWLPVRLSATTPASFNGWGRPWWDVSRRALNLTEGILSSYYNCTRTSSYKSQTKCFRAQVDAGDFSGSVSLWYWGLLLEFYPYV